MSNNKKTILPEWQRCQLCSLPQLSEPVPLYKKIVQKTGRLKRIFKRRYFFVRNFIQEIITPGKEMTKEIGNSNEIHFSAGIKVRIKSKKEIQSTLNNWNQLDGCAFMEEMWQFCGGEFRIFKRVDRFLDERDYLIKKCRGIYLLENVTCEGTNDFGPCDRSCFFFWKQEWLEEIG